MNQSHLRAFLVVLFWSSAGFAATPDEILQQIRTTRLDPSQAAQVTSVQLSVGGGGVLHLRNGLLVPATPIGAAPVEMVFIGEGKLQLDAPDAIEESQLELFTGSPRLSEEFDEGVFVLADGAAVKALLKNRSAEPAADKIARAAALYDKWVASPERKAMGVEAALFAYGLEDRFHKGYFGGWIQSRELDPFLYIYNPDSREELTVGQFVPMSLEKREQRKIRKRLEREQRRGRLLGMRLEDLGQWDTWVSASVGAEPKISSTPDFEPERYVLEIDVADRSLHVTGKARIDLTARSAVRQMVKLQLHSDLKVHRVSVAAADVPHFRSGSDLYVHLGVPPAANETVSVTVEYSGEVLEKIARKTIALRNTLDWYPHAGTHDRAVYDVTFRWPRELVLVSSGKRAGGGVTGERKWERRTLDHPSHGFSFELGHFREETFAAGHIAVTLAWDPEGRSFDDGTRDEIRKTVQDSLSFFEETYGRLPIDELTVVTAARGFSQSHFGFVTLSNLMMADFSIFAVAFGIEDRRTVIAHEIAHQWWGHMVGWSSYRDQWFTEALANYAALRFARKKLAENEPLSVGPISGWQSEILDTTEDGRTIESLGPLTLGGRLNSSRSEDAYDAIVYKKGAIVFGMLARNYGEDAFDGILRNVVSAGSNRQLSTGELLAIIRDANKKVDVDGFAKQFIFGTGLPIVLFDYEFVPNGPSKWKLKGSATQNHAVRLRHRIVPIESRYEVATEVIPQSQGTQWSMVVPFHLGIQRAGDERKFSKSEREVVEEIGNAFIRGRFWIRGEKTTPFELEIESPPKMFWLDRDKETLALFYSQRTNPKRILVSDASVLVRQRRFEEAEQKFKDALQAPKTTEFHPDAQIFGRELRNMLLKSQDDLLDARAHLGLARIRLDQKQYANIRAELQAARKATSLDSLVAGEIGILEGRLLIEEGDAEGGFKRLRKLMLGRSATVSDAEGYAWLAIAAKLTRNAKELEKALEAAERKGVDTTALK